MPQPQVLYLRFMGRSAEQLGETPDKIASHPEAHPLASLLSPTEQTDLAKSIQAICERDGVMRGITITLIESGKGPEIVVTLSSDEGRFNRGDYQFSSSVGSLPVSVREEAHLRQTDKKTAAAIETGFCVYSQS